MILHLKETVIRVSKNSNVSRHMYYLNFTFKGPEYVRNESLFMILLQFFLKH